MAAPRSSKLRAFVTDTGTVRLVHKREPGVRDILQELYDRAQRRKQEGKAWKTINSFAQAYSEDKGSCFGVAKSDLICSRCGPHVLPCLFVVCARDPYAEEGEEVIRNLRALDLLIRRTRKGNNPEDGDCIVSAAHLRVLTSCARCCKLHAGCDTVEPQMNQRRTSSTLTTTPAESSAPVQAPALTESSTAAAEVADPTTEPAHPESPPRAAVTDRMRDAPLLAMPPTTPLATAPLARSTPATSSTKRSRVEVVIPRRVRSRLSTATASPHTPLRRIPTLRQPRSPHGGITAAEVLERTEPLTAVVEAMTAAFRAHPPGDARRALVYETFVERLVEAEEALEDRVMGRASGEGGTHAAMEDDGDEAEEDEEDDGGSYEEDGVDGSDESSAEML